MATLTWTPVQLPVVAAIVAGWPWNGETVQPARSGVTVLTSARFYWGGVNR